MALVVPRPGLEATRLPDQPHPSGVPLGSIPVKLRDVAWIAGNGEPAWSPDHATEVVRWLAEHELAVAGLELYEQLPETEWGTFRREWSIATEARLGESWPDVVQRATREAAAIIAEIPRSKRALKLYVAVSSAALGGGALAPVTPVTPELGSVHRVRRGSEAATSGDLRS
jgi:hypothetical protein